MDIFIDNIIYRLMDINWEGPGIFVIIFLALLSLFKQWKILLLTLLTFVLAWGAEDLMIMSIETEMKVISIPLLVYCTGGGLTVILLLISFFKASVS